MRTGPDGVQQGQWFGASRALRSMRDNGPILVTGAAGQRSAAVNHRRSVTALTAFQCLERDDKRGAEPCHNGARRHCSSTIPWVAPVWR